MQNAIIMVDSGMSLFIGGAQYNVDKSHPNYTKIVEAAKAEDWAALPNLINVAKAIETYVAAAGGRVNVDVDNGVVNYNGEELHGTIADRLLRMMKEGFSVKPLVNFLENLMQNPSKRAVDELYGFLEFGKMPITDDGHFLAFKRVNDNYTSVHDGKTDNSIGKIVQMPRNKVNDNKDETCSHGLHFCSHGYLSSFSGNRVVVLKVNPRDVVSIPSDYNNTKGRACRYEVVGELSPEQVKKAMSGGYFNTPVNNDYEDRDVFGDDADFDEDGNERVSQEYINGYEHGRKDGRLGVLNGIGGGVRGDYAEGYRRGLKDGKGHKTRPTFAIKDDDLVEGDDQEQLDYDEGYQDGLEAGRDAASFDDEYNAEVLDGSDAYKNGYRDGYENGYAE